MPLLALAGLALAQVLGGPRAGPLTWSGALLLIASTAAVVVKSLVPAILRLLRDHRTGTGYDGAERRAEAGDFREMLVRLTSLAEANDRGMQRAADDREEMRDVLRALDAHKVQQIAMLEQLTKLADVAGTASIANQKMLNLIFEEVRPRKRRGGA